MWDALRGMLHVACLVFVFLKGAWSCLRWDMDIRARHFFSAPWVIVLWWNKRAEEKPGHEKTSHSCN